MREYRLGRHNPPRGNLRITRRLACGLLALFSARAQAQGSIAGTVYDSLRTRAALANATVVLVERSRYATTDAHGHFRIDSVPDGHYTLGFMHPMLDSLDLQAPVVAVDVSGGRRVSLTLSTPSPATAYARICPGPRDTDTGVIIGHVRDVDDAAALAGATISTVWTEFTVTGGRSAGHRVHAVAKTNPGGIYLLCGVPTDVPLDVHTELGGFVAGPTPLMPDDRLIRRVDFAVSRRDSAAREVLLSDSSKITTGFPGTATLRGVVRSTDGRPVHDAVVGVFGTQRSARTDAAGAFRIDGIPAGTRTIEVKSIGLLPLTFPVDFATNAARDTTLSVSRQAQDLTAVAVKERGNSMKLMESGGFETRRAQGLGRFVTEQDLARRPSTNLADVLASVSGMHVEYGTSGYAMPLLKGIIDTRVPQKGTINSSNNYGAYCVPNFFLDGAPFPVDGDLRPHGGTSAQPQAPFSDLADAARPETIRGIEVYSNPGTIPPQYDRMSSTGCGSIIIWTR